MHQAIKRIFLLAVLLLVLTACGQQPEDAAPTLNGANNAYFRAVADALPDYAPCPYSLRQRPNSFAAVSRGSVATLLDVQALPALEQGIGTQFEPQCLATVVFAVDPALTDARPRTWRALLDTDAVVSIPDWDLGRRLILAAAAYGLEGEDYSIRSALSLLEQLQRQGRLKQGRTDCPITICLDLDAAALKKQGSALEILVPRDGTLCYQLGLLSDHPVAGPTREQLLQAGLRLPEGSCDPALYPDRDAYRAASPVPDIDHFLNITKNATRNLRHTALHTRYLNSADGRQDVSMTILALIFTVFWMASALHRSTSRTMRRWIWLLAIQIILWMADSMVKHQLPTNLLSRMLWYFYYLFQIGLPLLLLTVACTFDRPPQNRTLPFWLKGCLAAGPLLILTVLTNDLHQLVFRFDPSGDWDSHYTYGPVYYLIIAFCITIFVVSLVLLILKSRKSARKWGWLLPLTVAILLLGYNLSYTLGLELARSTSYAWTFCVFCILFMESVFHAGLIPTNIGYRELFTRSPLRMQLLNEQGDPVLSSIGASSLTTAQSIAVRSQPGIPVQIDDNTLLHSRPIHGGTAVWQEDQTVINGLYRDLQASVSQMESANALLQKEGAIRRQKLAAEVKTELFEKLEASMEEKTRELSQTIRDLPQAEDRSRQIACIPLLLCHIKRQCNLFFLTRQDNRLSSSELAVYLDELSEFASYAQIHALVRCGLTGPLEIRSASLCYDFYFTLLSWAVKHSRATLIGQLEIREGQLHFDLLSSEPTDGLIFPDPFQAAVNAAHAILSRRSVEDSAGIYLVIPLQEVQP